MTHIASIGAVGYMHPFQYYGTKSYTFDYTNEEHYHSFCQTSRRAISHSVLFTETKSTQQPCYSFNLIAALNCFIQNKKVRATAI